MASATAPRRRTAVIGGGWAGCAAAIALVEAGHEVVLLDAARTLGGRARRVVVHGHALDNGQHILLGAYTQTLALLRRIGVDPRAAFLRLPLQLRYPPGTDGMDFAAPRLPAPWHLLGALAGARGLAFADRMALARFTTTARWIDWRLHDDCSVAELLDRYDQTPRTVALLWRPLCIAALNTPPERASAQIFLNVLHDSIGARRRASDMLVPRTDLGALLPDAAAEFLGARGGRVVLGARVSSIGRGGERWRIAGLGVPESDTFDRVIVATPSSVAAALLAPLGVALPDLGAEPIVTCYLQYDPAFSLPRPLYALRDDPDTGRWGQFVFDRGRLEARQAGLLAVVVSATGAALERERAALASDVAAQLAADFRMPSLAAPVWADVIAEKRATFSCTPGLQRPAVDCGPPGILLAGDYTDGPYPATLESAVRSGRDAARLAGKDMAAATAA